VSSTPPPVIPSDSSGTDRGGSSPASPVSGSELEDLTRRSIVDNMNSTVLPPDHETAALTAVSHRVLSDEVADRIREAIVTGRFKPGQHLREAEISRALQVSRSPVRDAFAQLGHEGLVAIRSHRGAIVVGLTAQDVEEVYTLRASLETLAVRLAISRATAGDFARLAELADQMPEAAARLSPREYAELDVGFHDLVYQLARHERLYSCWTMLRSHIFRFLLTRNLVNPDFSEVGHREHRELVDTMAAHETEKALEMIRTHLEGAYARLVAGYVEPGDRAGDRPRLQ
jgi:DNA-binding GntR family transcriptional regulator